MLEEDKKKKKKGRKIIPKRADGRGWLMIFKQSIC